MFENYQLNVVTLGLNTDRSGDISKQVAATIDHQNGRIIGTEAQLIGSNNKQLVKIIDETECVVADMTTPSEALAHLVGQLSPEKPTCYLYSGNLRPYVSRMIVPLLNQSGSVLTQYSEHQYGPPDKTVVDQSINRIMNIARTKRELNHSQRVIKSGALKIDRASHLILVRGKVVQVSEITYRTLERLGLGLDDIVLREKLLTHVSKYVNPREYSNFSHAVSTAISKFKLILNDDDLFDFHAKLGIRMVAKKVDATQSQVIKVRDFEIDPENVNAWLNSQPLRFQSSSQYNVLLRLAQEAGIYVPTAELMRQAYPEKEVVTPVAFRNLIAEIRTKFAETAEEPNYIHTQRQGLKGGKALGYKIQ